MLLSNTKGLSAGISQNGAISEIKANELRISMRNTGIHSLSGSGLFIRIPQTNQWAPLIGPGSNSHFSVSNNSYFAKGRFQGIEFRCILSLAEQETAWKWQLSLRNLNGKELEAEVFCVQDAGLKPASTGTINEYYASQYLERLNMHFGKYGQVICCRQNMKEGEQHPWLLMACQETADAAWVDGMQFYGPAFRQTAIPSAIVQNDNGSEYAGESSVLALKSKALTLRPGEEARLNFGFLFMAHHPQATGKEDLLLAEKLFGEIAFPKVHFPEKPENPPLKSLFNPPALLQTLDLEEADLVRFFGSERRFEEHHENQLLSFFGHKHSHVVLKAKESLTDRPHGHIIQTHNHLVPNEGIMSTNAFMTGVFNSHLTQGNTNFNTLLSVFSNQFHQPSEAGQRIFVQINDNWQLLGVPSAFEMGLNHCRWIYKTPEAIFEIHTWTSTELPQVNLSFELIEGKKLNLLITQHFDNSGQWQILSEKNNKTLQIKPGKNSLTAKHFPEGCFYLHLQHTDGEHLWSNDSLLNSDGVIRNADLMVLKLENTGRFSLSFSGALTQESLIQKFENARTQFSNDTQKALANWEKRSGKLQLQGKSSKAQTLNEILPWYGLNALTHYLTPYGLEQFGGAAWGTRDVSQGPVDFLLHLEKFKEARKVLCTIFSHQNPDGGWPQWWMFDSYHRIRAHEAHGDIIYWPIIALSKYISMTGDFNIMDETLPFYHEDGPINAEQQSLSEHINRLINMIVSSFIPGKALVPFGGGDWNDSLQPVSADLAQRLISSWTVMMNYQAFQQYAQVLEKRGELQQAERLHQFCESIKADFNKYLIRDEVVAGYGLMEADGSISLLLHPSDTTTGIKYSLLPMNRGVISGIFSPGQALHHQEIIRQHLLGPDGARLMDCPLKYNGGIQKIFQRAESSTFFGREIGLMYIHEHIRYAEALARTGKADEFMHALLQSIPVNYKETVPTSDFRQANCYYSSSDIAFSNRYDADANYHLLHSGKLTFRGGWRVYSSGPGIFTGLIISTLLGIRLHNNHIIFDPVIPKSQDGLKASLSLCGHELNIHFRIKNQGFSPQSILINRANLTFGSEHNPYRTGGAILPIKDFLSLLNDGPNEMEIVL